MVTPANYDLVTQLVQYCVLYSTTHKFSDPSQLIPGYSRVTDKKDGSHIPLPTSKFPSPGANHLPYSCVITSESWIPIVLMLAASLSSPSAGLVVDPPASLTSTPIAIADFSSPSDYESEEASDAK